MNKLREIANLQESYKRLFAENRLSKKAICDLVIPFRDKYKLTDKEALMITRNEISLSEIADLIGEGNNMLNRFENGTIVDFKAGECLKNNDVYILDPSTRKIRKPYNSDEWLTCQLVYVNNVSNNNVSNFYIDEGEMCRCWIGYLVI